MKRGLVVLLLFVFLISVINAQEERNPEYAPFDATVMIGANNNPPQLGQIDSEYFVCEGNLTKIIFNATDVDGDDPIIFNFPGLLNPFFFDQFQSQFLTIILSGGESFREVLLFTAIPLNKMHLGKHDIIIEVTDQVLVDRNFTNITVIEINNPPNLLPFEQANITLNETNRELYLELNVSDIEDGNRTDGNLSFNVTFLEGNSIFNVSKEGVINFTIGDNHVGEYEVLICVSDKAFDPTRIHLNISECGGIGVVTNQSDCEQFNLKIKSNTVIIQPSSSGGGGGGGGGISSEFCQVKWACVPWIECKRAEDALGQGILSGFQYRNIKDGCLSEGIGDEDCGYHTRDCRDAAFCNRTVEEPPKLEYCEYTIDASCFDGIRNCHDGGCEFLIDCGGGICDLCPTCSDGIKNQGEHEIDCGGPCPKICSGEFPFGSKNLISSLLEGNILVVGFILFTIFIIVLVIVLVKKYYNVRDLGEEF